MKPVLRWLIWTASAALLLLALLSLGVWLLVRGSVPQLQGERDIALLGGTVSIERDALGTTTIEGGSRRDVLRALGFVHAQERYFEMDLMRRAAAGELAALLGKATLPRDRELRVHRFRERSRTLLGIMTPDDRSLLQAYSDGVNEGLDALSVRPWHYLLLRQAPQPWQTEDSLLVMYAMYIQLQWRGHDRDLYFARLERAHPVVARMLERSGGSWDAALFPPHQLDDPALPSATELDLRVLDPALFGAEQQALAASPAAHLPLLLGGDCSDCVPGSNNWAVAGADVSHGNALLANDMHLGLGVPNIWFRTRLRYPDSLRSGRVMDLVGVSLPGMPGILVGSNGHVAWGFTNSYGDWTDWVRVRVHPDDPRLYAVSDGWEPFLETEQRIDVAGASSETLTLRETRWGPVLAEDEQGPLALSWVAYHPEALNLRLLDLARARTLDQAIGYAQQAGMPSQNILIADRHGRIGWTLTGPVPLRGGFDGRRPADFSTLGSGWVGWLDKAAYPMLIDPPENRLWSANSRVVGSQHLRLVGDGGYALGARAQEIRDRLMELPTVDEQSMLNLQLHARSALLDGWHALLTETLESLEPASDLHPLKLTIADFDGHARPESASYRLVGDFRARVSEKVLMALLVPARQIDAGLRLQHDRQLEHLVWTIVSQQPIHLLSPRYNDWKALFLETSRELTQSLAEKTGGLEARTWSERNRASIRHPLSTAVPQLSRWLDMPAEALPGDVHTPRVQSPRFGASQRLVVSPGKEHLGLLHMPGGQSGHPMSPFYGAGHNDWVEGRATPLLPGPPLHRLELIPRRN